MKLVVVIASLGRPDVLGGMLEQLASQTRQPDRVLLSLVDESDCPALDTLDAGFPIEAIYGRKGLAAQRNAGLEATLADADIITFFDDDFLPEASYLMRVEQAFQSHDDIAVVHGNVVADGVCGVGLGFEEGRAALAGAAALATSDTPVIRDHTSAYGCNMSFRASLVGGTRFDERLVLYGWQEDRDFSFQIGRKGRVAWLSNAVGVHLGVKGGRVNGLRLGYSQVVNPLYLLGKGTMPATAVANLMLRNIAANAARSVRPEPWVDRRGRLSGNLLALRDVLCGRIDPEHVLKL